MVASGTTLTSSGTDTGLTLDGGDADLQSGANVSGAITFVSSRYAPGRRQRNLCVGLCPEFDAEPVAAGDVIDLTGVTFSSGAAVSVSGGFLDVSVGGTTYAFGLGSPTSFPDEGFVVSGDGVSGTDVRLAELPGGVTVSKGNSPHIISGGTEALDRIVSGGTMIVEAGGVASDTTISSGGTLLVLFGGTADPTTISSGGTEIVSAHGTDLGAQISGGALLDYGFISGTTLFAGLQVVELGGTAGELVASAGNVMISAGGLVSAGTGILIPTGAAFSGGITNRGVVSGKINIANADTFAGSIVNSGLLAGATEVYVHFISTFAGGISNAGKISGAYGAYLTDVSAFTGGITNTGTIAAVHTAVGAFTLGSFGGGISNSGTISGADAVILDDVSIFSGGISNAGAITAVKAPFVSSGSPALPAVSSTAVQSRPRLKMAS